MFKSLKTQLTILQQEGYSIIRFLAWWIRHPLTFSISSKKPLIITPKARFIILLSYIVLTVSLLFLFFYGFTYFTLIPIFVFLISPFLYFFVALIVLWPYEKINR